MMPGDSYSKTVAIAADATVGNCQNCSVLHQSLNEYVSSFLALKQKITASDESIRLQQQLEELQIKLLSLEKKTADYDSVKAELEEKKDSLKAYEQMSVELQKIKQENSKILAENKKLEDQLSDVKELSETQSLENAQLKREKAVVENELLEAQTSLMKSQAQADQIKHLMEEKAKATSINETKMRQFEDSMCKQSDQINQLTKEKILLEKNIADLQARLMKLERERNKDFRSSSTQADAPKEKKIDKEQIRSLLQNLWACIEPQQHTANLLLPGSCSEQVPPSSPPKGHHPDFSNKSPSPLKTSKPLSHPKNTKHSPCRPRRVRKETCLQSPRPKKKTATPQKNEKSLEEPLTKDAVLGSSEISVEEIMTLFKPMLPCISPILDVDLESKSLEAGDGKETDLTKTSDPHQQEQSSPITTSVLSHPLKASVAQKEDNMVVPLVRTQGADHISSENNTTEKNDMSNITEMEEEEEMQIEEEQAAEQLVSAPASCAPFTPVCVDAVLPNTEGQKPSCEVNSKSGGFNNTSGMETEKDFSSNSITKMDIDTNLSGETKTSDRGESPRGGDTTAISEQGDVELGDASATSCLVIDSDRDAEVTNTENSLDVGKVHEDSCDLVESLNNTKPKENEECFAEYIDVEKGCLSSSDSNTFTGEKLENDAPVQLPKEEDGNEMHKKKEEDGIRQLEKKEKGVDITASPCVSGGDNKPLSPSESPQIRTENFSSHQESSQANSETPLKKKANKKKLNTETTDHGDHGSSLSDTQETKNVNCDSLQEKTHSPCKTLSTSCLFPTAELCTLETSPKKEQLDVAKNIKHISTSKKTIEPMFNEEEESAVENTHAKDFSEDGTEARIHQSGEFDTVLHETLLNRNPSAKEEQNKCLELEKMPGAVIDSLTTKQPEILGQLLTEMGPPLPPILTPVCTPPKAGKSINPKQAIGKLHFPSPMERVASPTTPALAQARLTPNSQKQSTSSRSSPLRPNGVPSSPLQFGSATPKHAVPVPGRLPRTASVSSSPPSSSPSQENSMRILDTMYPELSAHARTLSILRGNVSLGCSSDIGTSPSMKGGQVSGFQTITSTPTAFTKAETRGEKRQADNLPQPNNRKCLRLENSPPTVSHKQVYSLSLNSGEEMTPSQNREPKKLQNETTSSCMDAEPTKQHVIDGCLKKIENSCFDLLPVIQSHLYVGNLPKKPVLTDQEKEVISEICQSSMLEADDVLLAILNKLKVEKKSLDSKYTQALCRVHTGICRQKRDWEKAHILAYSILTEDFPDAAKLILFMVTTWPTVLSHSSPLCKAIHAVTKLKAQENLLNCLSAFLSWEKSPPCDVNELISKTLSDIRSGLRLSFTKHTRHGTDLGTEAWELICTLHLLCANKKWMWTYENVLGNELWPLMNTWVTQPRDQQAPVSDVTVATVLRLIGRLSQLGIRERNISSVSTAAHVINTFGRHGHTEGVPWEVQLAAIYCIYDLSPVNPKQALDSLAGWIGETSQSIPPTVKSCINQLSSVCRQIKT
ncbi:little elongation complex subunit 1 [Halichoeres trimaculatus]|uniref:little elongation complex subunit 1 n=1 Tax=Halichoeres trimaculatus TaxID=147232 RepID=UPI003D9E42CB